MKHGLICRFDVHAKIILVGLLEKAIPVGCSLQDLQTFPAELYRDLLDVAFSAHRNPNESGSFSLLT